MILHAILDDISYALSSSDYCEQSEKTNKKNFKVSSEAISKSIRLNIDAILIPLASRCFLTFSTLSKKKQQTAF